MRTKNKKAIEQKLKILILANLFFFFLFMLVKDEEIKSTFLNIYFLLLLFSVSLLYFKNSCKKLGLSKQNLSKGIFFGFIAFFSIFLFTIFVELVVDFFGINVSTGVEEVLSGNLILILSAIFISPISEEIFFRATLLDFLEKNIKNENISIILSSFVFSIFHFGYGSVLEILGAFVAGVVFAFTYKKSKTIIAPIFGHFLYNFLSIILLILNF